MAAGLIKVAVAAAAGAMVAAGVAVAASPLMPIGAARLAEPDPGVSADAAVLAAGAAAIVVLLVARAAWPAWRLASAGARRGRPPAAPGLRSRLAAWLAAHRRAGDRGGGGAACARAGPRAHRRAGAQRPGRHRAVGARGDRGVHLRREPAASGQHPAACTGKRWDAAIDLQFADDHAGGRQAPARPPARHRRLDVRTHGIIGIGGHVIPAIGLTAGKGPLLSPTLLQGRPPRTSSEIVLGTSTLRQIGRHVGQTVTVTVNGRPLRARIVGRAVFPNFGQGSFTPTDLGQGAETTAAVLKAQAALACRPGFQFVLLQLHPRPATGPRTSPASSGP